MKKVAIIGAGIMGNGIAQSCTQNKDLKILVIDPFESALELFTKKISENIDSFLAKGLITEESKTTLLSRIELTTDYSKISDADIVFEVIPEKFELKKQLFEQLSKLCRSDCIFASNTSGIPITNLAQTASHPERVVGTHFFQPAHLIPLVEVIQTKFTAIKTIEKTMSFLSSIGKTPAHIKKDVPGFVANRLQHALSREAMYLVQEKVVSVEDLDKIFLGSVAPRLVFTGPLQQRDMNGLDTHLAINEYLYKDLNNCTEPLEIIKQKVASGDYGVKSGRGFYDWSGQSAVEIYSEKNNELIELFKFLKSLQGAK